MERPLLIVSLKKRQQTKQADQIWTQNCIPCYWLVPALELHKLVETEDRTKDKHSEKTLIWKLKYCFNYMLHCILE